MENQIEGQIAWKLEMEIAMKNTMFDKRKNPSNTNNQKWIFKQSKVKTMDLNQEVEITPKKKKKNPPHITKSGLFKISNPS